jgi:hypothetical protein
MFRRNVLPSSSGFRNIFLLPPGEPRFHSDLVRDVAELCTASDVTATHSRVHFESCVATVETHFTRNAAFRSVALTIQQYHVHKGKPKSGNVELPTERDYGCRRASIDPGPHVNGRRSLCPFLLQLSLLQEWRAILP